MSNSGGGSITTNRIYVCRHSERIDEANKDDYKAWLESIDTLTNATRPLNDIKKDPIITEDGVLYAQTLGTTLSTIKELQDTISCIYCSRLQRCIQTAYEVAKILNVPIFISTGLAQTAKAIEQLDSKDCFQFLSLPEIRELYNEVEWYCCDESYDKDGIKLTDTIPCYPQVPWKDWLSPLNYIAANNKVSIIVAHRETIRKIVGSKIETPYCCYGVYDYKSKNHTHKKVLEFIETRTREGQVIKSLP